MDFWHCLAKKWFWFFFCLCNVSTAKRIEDKQFHHRCEFCPWFSLTGQSYWDNRWDETSLRIFIFFSLSVILLSHLCPPVLPMPHLALTFPGEIYWRPWTPHHMPAFIPPFLLFLFVFSPFFGLIFTSFIIDRHPPPSLTHHCSITSASHFHLPPAELFVSAKRPATITKAHQIKTVLYPMWGDWRRWSF